MRKHQDEHARAVAYVEREFDKLIARADDSKKRFYRKYMNSLRIRGVSPHTLKWHMEHLKKLHDLWPCDFDSLTEDDIEDILIKIDERKDLQRASKQNLQTGLKAILKFAGREDLANSYKIQKDKSRKLPEDLLTREEIGKLIDACNNLRDKALISLLYESGGRRGELIGMKIKHLEPHEKGMYVHLPEGKTGARKILVVYSSMYLHQWLNVHPLKGNRDAPLWCTLNNHPEVVSTSAFTKILKNVATRAGIQKRVNPHSFRHAQATELAKDFTEQQLKRYLGWTQSSTMAAIYVHLSGRDIDDAILKKNGIEVEDRDTRLKPEECSRCHNIIPNGVNFCGFCGLPLTAEAESNSQQTINAILAQLKERPEILLEAIKNLG